MSNLEEKNVTQIANTLTSAAHDRIKCIIRSKTILVACRIEQNTFSKALELPNGIITTIKLLHCSLTTDFFEVTDFIKT